MARKQRPWASLRGGNRKARNNTRAQERQAKEWLKLKQQLLVGDPFARDDQPLKANGVVMASKQAKKKPVITDTKPPASLPSVQRWAFVVDGAGSPGEVILTYAQADPGVFAVPPRMVKSEQDTTPTADTIVYVDRDGILYVLVTPRQLLPPVPSPGWDKIDRVITSDQEIVWRVWYGPDSSCIVDAQGEIVGEIGKVSTVRFVSDADGDDDPGDEEAMSETLQAINSLENLEFEQYAITVRNEVVRQLYASSSLPVPPVLSGCIPLSSVPEQRFAYLSIIQRFVADGRMSPEVASEVVSNPESKFALYLVRLMQFDKAVLGGTAPVTMFGGTGGYTEEDLEALYELAQDNKPSTGGKINPTQVATLVLEVPGLVKEITRLQDIIAVFLSVYPCHDSSHANLHAAGKLCPRQAQSSLAEVAEVLGLDPATFPRKLHSPPCQCHTDPRWQAWLNEVPGQVVTPAEIASIEQVVDQSYRQSYEDLQERAAARERIRAAAGIQALPKQGQDQGTAFSQSRALLEGEYQRARAEQTSGWVGSIRRAVGLDPEESKTPRERRENG